MRFSWSTFISVLQPGQLRLHRPLLVLVLGALTSLPLQAQEGLPEWFQTNMERESKLEKTVGFEIANSSTADVATAGKILANTVSEPELDADGDYYLEFDIGGKTAVGCYLFGGDIDLGGSLIAMLDNTIELQASQGGELQAKQIFNLDGGAIDSSPFVALDWIYVIASDVGTQLGYVKGRVARKNGRGIYCGHNEVGYRESFSRSFESLVRNLIVPGNELEPSYVEIHKMLVNGQTFGVDAVSLYDLPDGTTRYLEQGVILLPLDGSTLRVSDEQTEGIAAADGTTLQESALEVVDGELVADLLLVRDGENYSVAGRSKGEPFEASFKRGPTSVPAEMKDLLELVTNKEKNQLVHWEWDAGDSPGALKKMDGRVTARDGDTTRMVLSALGEQFDTTVDATGSVVRGVAEMNGSKFEIERVYLSPKAP